MCGFPIRDGAVVELKVLLKVSTLSETVTVTGDSPVVNLASTTVSTNYNKQWVEAAPIRHFSFFDLVNSAPGVSATSTTAPDWCSALTPSASCLSASIIYKI